MTAWGAFACLSWMVVFPLTTENFCTVCFMYPALTSKIVSDCTGFYIIPWNIFISIKCQNEACIEACSAVLCSSVMSYSYNYDYSNHTVHLCYISYLYQTRVLQHASIPRFFPLCFLFEWMLILITLIKSHRKSARYAFYWEDKFSLSEYYQVKSRNSVPVCNISCFHDLLSGKSCSKHKGRREIKQWRVRTWEDKFYNLGAQTIYKERVAVDSLYWGNHGQATDLCWWVSDYTSSIHS